MCRIVVKDVRKVHEVKRGNKDGKAWELFIFDCLVSVDGSAAEAVRTVKTFEADLAGLVKDGAVLDARKEGEAAPFSFMLRKQGHGGGGKSQGIALTDRQLAFREANRLVSAAVPAGLYETPEDAASATLEIAGKYLDFLKG